MIFFLYEEIFKNNFRIDYDGAYETKLMKQDGSFIEVEILGKTLTYRL